MRLTTIGLVALLLAATPVSLPPGPLAAAESAGLPSAAPAEQGLVTIRIGVPAPVASQWPYFVAERKGFLRDERLDSDYNALQTEARAMAALVGGSLDMAIVTPGPTVLAIERGGAVKAVAGVQNRATYSLVTARDVLTAADLRGKTVGTDSLGSVVTMYTKRLIRDASGLIADRDYDFVTSGSISDRLTALQVGAIQGTLIGPPFDTQARQQGYNIVADTTNLRAQWTLAALRQGFIDEQRPASIGFLRALGRGARWLYDPANRDEAIAILTERLNQTADLSAANYDQLVTQLQVYTRDGSPDLQGVQTVLEMMVDEGQLPNPPPPVTRYYDDSLLRAALGS